MARKAHLIGISGMGMSALALLLKQKGWQVSGSDIEFYDPAYSLLRKNGIKFFKKYSKKHINKDLDLIVVGGKHSNLEREKNEEVRAAFASDKEIKSVPQILGELGNKTENTVVAGSFGKSTTTALLTWCLIKSKKNPSYFIGGIPIGFRAHAKLDKGKHFILEGDEYPSSNWDTRSKFLHLRPKNLILISAEHDHMNVFPTEKDYLKPYRKLISLLPRNGLLVASNEGRNVEKIIKSAKCRIVNYGFTKKSTWHPENISYGLKTSFDLSKGKKKIIRLETSLLGNHNVENIVGVSAFLLEKKLITVKQLQNGVRSFKGLERRLDLKTKKSSVLVYEGFGSSYTKAKSVFDALKLHFSDKKLITIFEPHSASWSNARTKRWYRNILKTSDAVILLPVPAHRAGVPNQMTSEQILKIIKKHHKKTYFAKTEKETLKILKKITKEDDVIALVSSGSLLGLSKSVPKLMEKIFSKEKIFK